MWLEADTDGDEKLTVQEMTNFLRSSGVDTNTVIIYGFSVSDVQHVAKRCAGKGNACSASSKLGRLWRISHDRGELEGGPAYGSIVGTD